ncbi:Polyisoprenoid-binding protein YceI [Hymenobacter gelipurpurascens]|uniref:Polyisoprenoid-binding protein YceI n=1 Tax=Hymenobacter gelipurpurascens TaxID=89968 RepID=A0A212U8P0_9BACT|nr:YceI family protein [Hymenobacter gelipurpurascens]SNC74638.1 Polyisoprenoid-binding protein YceI [Hymenobacter gelipurpurascens]
MKTLCLFFVLLGICAFQPAATTYQVNPEASRLAWTGYAEVGTYAPTGTVQLRQGTFGYDGNRLRNGRFEIDMRTIAQEQAQLAEHLRGPDFFDVEHYPTAVFVLIESKNGQALGQFTLKVTTRPVRFPLTITRLPNGQLRIQGTATLDRTQFGVNYNSSSFFQNLGNYAIRNEFLLRFDVVADKQ